MGQYLIQVNHIGLFRTRYLDLSESCLRTGESCGSVPDSGESDQSVHDSEE